MRKEFPSEPKAFFERLFKTNWVVYAKRPFGGPLQVIEYLGRYTHKIAISNHRISALQKDSVSFAYRDYRQAGNRKEMTLTALEFIRRFAMHILPKRFVRIRHYGILSSKIKAEAIPVIREQLNSCFPEDASPEVTVLVPEIVTPTCPCCKKGLMKHLMDFDHRGPPVWCLKLINRSEKKATLQIAM